MSDKLCRLRAYQCSGYDQRKFTPDELASLRFAEYVSTCSVRQISGDAISCEYLRPISIEQLTDEKDAESYVLHFRGFPDPIDGDSVLTLLSHGKSGGLFKYVHFAKADREARSWVGGCFHPSNVAFEYNYENQELKLTILHSKAVVYTTPPTHCIDTRLLVQY